MIVVRMSLGNYLEVINEFYKNEPIAIEKFDSKMFAQWVTKAYNATVIYRTVPDNNIPDEMDMCWDFCFVEDKNALLFMLKFKHNEIFTS